MTPRLTRHALDGIAANRQSDESLRNTDDQTRFLAGGRVRTVARARDWRRPSAAAASPWRGRTSSWTWGEPVDDLEVTSLDSHAVTGTLKEERPERNARRRNAQREGTLSGTLSQEVRQAKSGSKASGRVRAPGTEGPGRGAPGACGYRGRQDRPVILRLPGVCGPWRDASGSPPGHHASSGEPGNRGCACAAEPRVDRCAS